LFYILRKEADLDAGQILPAEHEIFRWAKSARTFENFTGNSSSVSALTRPPQPIPESYLATLRLFSSFSQLSRTFLAACRIHQIAEGSVTHVNRLLGF